MELLNIQTAHGLAETLYGTTVSNDDFEELALNAWELINNKHTRLYSYIGNTECCELALPCNVSVIESVHIPINDAKTSDVTTNGFDPSGAYVEGYIEHFKWNSDPLYSSGKLIKYREGDGVLVFARDFNNVKVVYHGVIVDDEGLPLVTAKEARAIAAYIAYMSLYKKALVNRDATFFQFAQTVKEDWLRKCNAARVPDHLSLNDMNDVLEVRVRWDRKQYGKSLKPIL